MRLSTAVLLVCLVGRGYALTVEYIEEQWKQFKTLHQKSYTECIVEDFRFKIFKENLIQVEKHNKEFEEGKQNYTIGINQFSDQLHSEVMDELAMNIDPLEVETILRNADMMSEKQLQELMNEELPMQVDWREIGAVTPVENQGRDHDGNRRKCSSCWAFAATGALESQKFLKLGTLVDLSEQNLVDCCLNEKYSCNGCSGGFPHAAYNYIRDNGGIDSDSSYPYDAKREPCKFDKTNIAATVQGSLLLRPGDELALKVAVAKLGPIAAGIDMYGTNFDKFSGGGVYSTTDCVRGRINHAILVIGYGTTQYGQDYWLIKNSWGPYWGENGYAKIARNVMNMCNIATYQAIPVVAT